MIQMGLTTSFSFVVFSVFLLVSVGWWWRGRYWWQQRLVGKRVKEYEKHHPNSRFHRLS